MCCTVSCVGYAMVTSVSYHNRLANNNNPTALCCLMNVPLLLASYTVKSRSHLVV